MREAPRKVKHRKWQKGRSLNRNKETRGVKLVFGNFGLQALTSAWLTYRQLESARRVIVHYLKSSGRIWIRVFPDKPVTKFPPEVGMGGGKGSVDHYVCPVKPGRIIIEIDSPDHSLARKALTLAGYKLPLKTKVISAT